MTGNALRPRTVIAILAVWVLCVLPFTGLGYGSDADAWLVARAADSIWNTSHYTASRSTGFPLFEILEAPLVHAGGWQCSNLLATAGGAAMLAALLFLASKRRFRNPFFVVAAAAFLPVVMKNASSTMDYLPGLALLLWSLAMAQERRLALAGVLVGLACGFRPTNALWLLPLLLFLRSAGAGGRDLLRLALPAFVVGCVAYAPAVLTVGLKSSYAVMSFDLKTRALLAAYNGAQLFGLIGWVALAAATALHLRRGRMAGHAAMPRSQRLFHWSVIAVWTLLFLLLPDEPEYLLPALPSILMLADAVATPRMAWVLLLAFLSYHALRIETLGGDSGQRRAAVSIRPGYTCADAEDRLFKLSVREAAATAVMKRPTVLMYGALWVPVRNPLWSYDTALAMHRRGDGNLYLSDKILDAGRLRALRAQGFRLVVWNADKWEYFRAAVPGWQSSVEVVDDLGAFLGRPLAGRPLTMK